MNEKLKIRKMRLHAKSRKSRKHKGVLGQVKNAGEQKVSQEKERAGLLLWSPGQGTLK